MKFEDESLSPMDRARIIGDLYSEKEYIANIQKCDDFYRGEQEKHLPPIGKEDDSDYNEREKLWINLTQPIVDKRASVYEGQAARKIDGDKNYQDIMEKAWEDKHQVFQEIDLRAELNPFCCVRVFHDIEKDVFTYTPYAANATFPYVDDDTGEIEALCLRWYREIRKKDEKIEQILYEEVWDKNEWKVYEDNRLIGEGEHKYGFLPFVFFFADQRIKGYFANPASHDVVNQNYNINSLLSDLRYVCQYQSFGQLVLTVKEIDKQGNAFDENKQIINPKSITVGIRKVLALPEGGSAEFIHPNAAIKELMDVVEFLIGNLYTTSHVPKVTLAPSETTASGVSLIVQWYPLIGLLNKKRSSYKVAENELVRKTLLIHERNKGKTDNLKDYTFTVNFDEGSAPKSSEEQINIDKFEIEIGITSTVELLMRKDPDLTEEEALEKLKKIEERNREILSVRTSLSDNEKDALDKKIENLNKINQDKKKNKGRG